MIIAIYVNQQYYKNMDLGPVSGYDLGEITDAIDEGTPADVHALQWVDVAGWIEYEGPKVNETITVLPQWALNAMAAWDVAYDEDHQPVPQDHTQIPTDEDLNV
jgi:hypothetical protein